MVVVMGSPSAGRCGIIIVVVPELQAHNINKRVLRMARIILHGARVTGRAKLLW
jgi:hypothetical protein